MHSLPDGDATQNAAVWTPARGATIIPGMPAFLANYLVPGIWGLILLATAEHPPLFSGLNQYTAETVLTNLSAPLPARLERHPDPAPPAVMPPAPQPNPSPP